MRGKIRHAYVVAAPFLDISQTPPVLHARFSALVVIPLPGLTLCIPRVPGSVLSMFVEILLLALQLASTSTNDRLVCVRPSPRHSYLFVRAPFSLSAVCHECVLPSST